MWSRRWWSSLGCDKLSHPHDWWSVLCPSPRPASTSTVSPPSLRLTDSFYSLHCLVLRPSTHSKENSLSTKKSDQVKNLLTLRVRLQGSGWGGVVGVVVVTQQSPRELAGPRHETRRPLRPGLLLRGRLATRRHAAQSAIHADFALVLLQLCNTQTGLLACYVAGCSSKGNGWVVVGVSSKNTVSRSLRNSHSVQYLQIEPNTKKVDLLKS